MEERCFQSALLMRLDLVFVQIFHDIARVLVKIALVKLVFKLCFLKIVVGPFRLFVDSSFINGFFMWRNFCRFSLKRTIL